MRTMLWIWMVATVPYTAVEAIQEPESWGFLAIFPQALCLYWLDLDAVYKPTGKQQRALGFALFALGSVVLGGVVSYGSRQPLLTWPMVGLLLIATVSAVLLLRESRKLSFLTEEKAPMESRKTRAERFGFWLGRKIRKILH